MKKLTYFTLMLCCSVIIFEAKASKRVCTFASHNPYEVLLVNSRGMEQVDLVKVKAIQAKKPKKVKKNTVVLSHSSNTTRHESETKASAAKSSQEALNIQAAAPIAYNEIVTHDALKKARNAAKNRNNKHTFALLAGQQAPAYRNRHHTINSVHYRDALKKHLARAGIPQTHASDNGQATHDTTSSGDTTKLGNNQRQPKKLNAKSKFYRRSLELSAK